MVQLINRGVVRQTGANHVEESKLAWKLGGNIMQSREVGQRVEAPSLAACEEPADVERARQRRELETI